MALLPTDLAWQSNAVARIEQTINTIQRLTAEVSARYPETGTSDVFSAAMRALQNAKDKLQIESYNRMYRDERGRD